MLLRRIVPLAGIVRMGAVEVAEGLISLKLCVCGSVVVVASGAVDA